MQERQAHLKRQLDEQSYLAAVWGQPAPDIKIEDSAVTCELKTMPALAALGEVDEKKMQEAHDVDEAIRLLVEAEQAAWGQDEEEKEENASGQSGIIVVINHPFVCLPRPLHVPVPACQ